METGKRDTYTVSKNGARDCKNKFHGRYESNRRLYFNLEIAVLMRSRYFYFKFLTLFYMTLYRCPCVALNISIVTYKFIIYIK